MGLVRDSWDNILEEMRAHTDTGAAYNTWIAPLTVYEETEDSVYILVKQNSSIEHITYRYTSSIKEVIREVTGNVYEVIFITNDEESIEEAHHAIQRKKLKLRKKTERMSKTNLIEKYTFDTFIVGKSNELAQAVSMVIAQNPGEEYNPLFIYGGVGLGKTHLMHSIGNYVATTFPELNVLYETSEAYTNLLIEALRLNRKGNAEEISKFRERYRSLDVLLIDDIQFIIGKDRTEEEFFHTFNALFQEGRQIVVSCDKPQKDIPALEERFKTRFNMGILANISQPDYETRMAIIREKTEINGIQKPPIPEEVLEYIANNITTNIRDIEGALTKLSVLAKFSKVDIDINLAAEVLKEFISSDQSREVTPELILKVVCEHYQVTEEAIKSTRRTADIVVPRQIIMYLSREITSAPLKHIGVMLGRDHSTVMSGINKIISLISGDNVDESIKTNIDIIKKKISPHS